MWNKASELMKREQGLLNHSFADDCYGSKFVLDHMVATYLQCGAAESLIRFNRNGDFFGFRNGAKFCVWDSFKRVEKFHFKCEDDNWRDADFRFLNNLSNQSDFKIAITCREKVELCYVTPAGSVSARETIQVPSAEKKRNYLDLCPSKDAEMFCIHQGDSIYRIDLRCNPAVVDKNQHELLRFYTLAHNPIKPEICSTGLGPYVRTFDTRKLNTPLKEYKIDSKVDDDVFESCEYNFDGSEILSTDAGLQTYLIYNDNSEKHFQKYDNLQVACIEPKYFGPKSEYLVYVECYELDFQDKYNFKKHTLRTLDVDNRFVEITESFGAPAMHPNKPIIIMNLDCGYLMFCAPKGTYDSYIVGDQLDSDDDDYANNDDIEFGIYY